MPRAQDVERPYAALGRAIQTARRRHELTQRELAQHIGVHLGYITLIERGRRHPKLAVLTALARELSLPLDELSVLAGYLPPPRGDLRIEGGGETAELLRRLADYPPALLRLLLEIAEPISAYAETAHRP
jgi:transcriptional regulator with XRE-family HTH domain